MIGRLSSRTTARERVQSWGCAAKQGAAGGYRWSFVSRRLEAQGVTWRASHLMPCFSAATHNYRTPLRPTCLFFLHAISAMYATPIPCCGCCTLLPRPQRLRNSSPVSGVFSEPRSSCTTRPDQNSRAAAEAGGRRCPAIPGPFLRLRAAEVEVGPDVHAVGALACPRAVAGEGVA